jgi:ubiquitin C-terminal hydrolase
MRGLKNLGNTCYFNVAIQCLAHVPPLAQHLMLHEYTGPCSITAEYQKVLRQLFIRGTEEPVVPDHLLGAFRGRYPNFTEGVQHDAQEVILLLIDVFEKSINLKVFSPLPTFVLPVLEPSSLAELLDEAEEPAGWPEIISFTFCMYDHKFPVSIPFNFNDRRLFAVVLHKGSKDCGHYAILVKVREKWYIKEDETIYELLCGIDTMRGEFYMAFYRPDNLLRRSDFSKF